MLVWWQNMKTFKKIFDLDCKEVEDYIRKDVVEHYSKYDNCLPPEKYYVHIEWAPWCNEFYACISPKLDHDEKYKHYFIDGKELSLADYFEIKDCHWHYTFQAIYGEMTGEPTVVEEVGTSEPNVEVMLDCRYNKQWILVVKDKGSDKWYCCDYDENDNPYKYDAPSDLLKAVSDYMAEQSHQLIYT